MLLEASTINLKEIVKKYDRIYSEACTITGVSVEIDAPAFINLRAFKTESELLDFLIKLGNYQKNHSSTDTYQLGYIYAKSASAITNDNDTNNITPNRQDAKKLFLLQDVARNVIMKNTDINTIKDYPRIHNCCRALSYGNFNVDVVVGGGGGGGDDDGQAQQAHYENLQHCNSVWVCPVCSTRIANERKELLKKTIEYSYNNKKKCIMVTYTVPHYYYDSLPELLDKFNYLLDIKNTRAYRNLLAEIGYAGSVRKLEVTWSYGHGFHPHCHEMLLLNPGVDIEKIREKLMAMWAVRAEKIGIPINGAFQERAINVVPLKEYGYIAKVMATDLDDFANEIVGNGKNARGKNLTPFQILAVIAKDTLNERTKKIYENAYMAYCRCFKGKRQLFYSPGLKDRVLDSVNIGVQEQEQKVITLSECQFKHLANTSLRGNLLVLLSNGNISVIPVRRYENTNLEEIINTEDYNHESMCRAILNDNKIDKILTRLMLSTSVPGQDLVSLIILPGYMVRNVTVKPYLLREKEKLEKRRAKKQQKELQELS